VSAILAADEATAWTVAAYSSTAVAEIGLFPLELVLLPTERVPLHIFEDRYKELIGECLAEDSEFGLILETEEGLREIGTRTAVLEVIHTFDDGRMNVLVEGHGRFRVARMTEGRSFHTAEVEPIEDEEETPSEDDVAQVMEVFRRLVAVAEAQEIDEPEAGSGTLSFQLAARVDFGHELKQELLELRSERRRLKRLGELLERAVTGLAREAEVRERASGNGKVTPHPD
jgi:ATP-dependent Lon protease